MSQLARISHILRWGAACLLTAVLACGCAHRAAVSSWKPAEIEVGGMQRVAVLGFSGEHGDAAVAAVKSRLWDSEFYTLVDHSDLSAIRWASATDRTSSLLSLDELQAARAAGIDSVLVGDVIDYRCEDRPASEEERQWGPFARPTQQESAGEATPDEADRRALTREAAVTLAFRLVDAKTGNIRASRQISHASAVPVIDRTSGTPAPAPDALLDDLTRKCVDDFVSTLAPHQVTEHVKLAMPTPFQAGCTLVQNGNEFAVRGRWDEAMAAWERALDCNPENDAALFNLSIAHANRQQFNQAETFAIRAMNVRQKAEYQAGLQRIREQTAAYDQTLQQRRDVTTLSFADEDVRWPHAARMPTDRATKGRIRNRE